VRWMRRWLMWTAVSIATMALKQRGRFAAFVATLVLLAALLIAWAAGWLSDLLGSGLAWLPPALVFLAGFAFGRLWALTVIGLLLVTAPTIIVWCVLIIVWLLDYAKAIWNRVRGRRFERPPLVPREPRLHF
jgi:MFS family permease